MAKGTFVDYVVNNDPNKYPSDGLHTDGYYYEKVGTKVTSGEITFSSAVKTITIEHGLGTEPKYVFLIGIQTNSNSNTYKLINGYKDNESSRIITILQRI